MKSHNEALHHKRMRAERRFIWYGRIALASALAVLVLLLLTLFWRGVGGFTQTFMAITLPAQHGLTADMSPAALQRAAQQALLAEFPEVAEEEQQIFLNRLMTSASGVYVRRALKAVNDGAAFTVWVPTSAALDMAYKEGLSDTTLDAQSFVWANMLDVRGKLQRRFNTTLFTDADSRNPERAGFLGAIVGSLLTVFSCLAVAFPIGVMAAVYLEEFSRKGRLRDLIEVNINNLAAVPSIVYGLLGLAVYLNTFGLPRSAPLVGGLTLALMILPVIIISTRASLKAVPDSIRAAALALGATPLQTLWHHTLPLAMPGVMTGTILGVARALGETAPLLMVGMVAFVADVPESFLDPATVMPVQVYLWAGSPEAGFAAKTSAGILILLVILLALNALAIVLRKRFETKW